MPHSETIVPHSVMVSQIDAAVLAEREACAKVAEEWIHEPVRGWYSATRNGTARGIAAKIRARRK